MKNKILLFVTLLHGLLMVDKQVNCFLNLNSYEYLKTIIYKCPLIPDPMYPDRLDQSIIVFNDNKIENLIKSAPIIIRTEANIMHRVSFLLNIDDYSFYHASAADIEDIFQQTNTSIVINKAAKMLNRINLQNEDVINDFEYNKLKSLSRTENGVYEIQDDDLINHEIYKCIGNYNPYLKFFSVFIILKLTPTTSKYNIGDTIFSLNSFGYLESVDKISEIETTDGNKIILETSLIQCGNYRNSIYTNIIRRHELDTNSSELDCSGGSNFKLYLIDYESLHYNLNSESIGKLIPGRETSSFGIKVLSKQIIGEYVVYEGISVTHSFDNNTLAAKLSISINKDFSHKFSKTYGYKAELAGITHFLNLLIMNTVLFF
jgi:hypothetical protein